MPKKLTTKLHLQNFEKLLIETVLCSRANTVDPDETAHYEPSHLDLQCLQIQLLLCLALLGVTSRSFL